MVALEEINVVMKYCGKECLRVAVAYPSLYHVAVDSLSFQMLYHYLNKLDGIVAERAVYLKRDEAPTRTLESKTPLRSVDVLMFSVHYELDYVNIVRTLLEAGIEPEASKRERPLVVVGGPPVIANPLPLSRFADVLVVGEIEPSLPFLVEKLLEERGLKKSLLESLPPSQGFFAPQVFSGDEVRFNAAESLPLEFHPIAQVQPLKAPFKWKLRTAIETSRGCLYGCRFCMEGWIFRGVRERPVGDVLEIAEKGSVANRSKLVKLVSLSFFNHRRADEILEKLVNEGFEVSVPSLRADTLNEDRLELLRRGGQKTLVIAPETGSLRLASVLGKFIKLDLAAQIAAEAKRLGFTGLKLYLMVGVPGESDEDLISTAEYVTRLSKQSGYQGSRQLKITVSPLVPKPHTPLERAPFVGVKEARRRIELLKRKLRGLADVRAYDPRLAWAQTILARGGAELGIVLQLWALKGGGLGGLRAALREANLNPERYTGYLTDELPWSFVKLAARVRS
jgi:radical SAM superfamily enzyme YgiQ (UPF0313 family)